jgi:ABC-type multidrug transport system fused ATPase/permease subunit
VSLSREDARGLKTSLRLLPPLNQLPDAIMYLLRTLISTRRIKRFLDEPEVAPHGPPSDGIDIQDAVFTWPAHASENVTFRLHVSDFRVSPGDLVVISGRSSSGKTALLNALLGEMQLESGSYKRPKGCMAYSAQRPWAESMTIRANIVFHTKYIKTRFDQVIEACGLKTDLEALEHGELTSLGERGVNLSGGQRARLALARAIYSFAPVVLLDGKPLASGAPGSL